MTPTVARILHYWPSQYDVEQAGMTVHDAKQPMAALIVHVQSETQVDLVVWDHNGMARTRQDVRLKQDGQVMLDNTGYAEWPQRV